VNASLDLDVVLPVLPPSSKKHIDYEIFGVLLVEPGDGALKHRFSIGILLTWRRPAHPDRAGITAPRQQPAIRFALAT